MTKGMLLAALLAFAAAPALAQKKSCDDVKAEIEAKLKLNRSTGYKLDIVAADVKVEKDVKVVGTCDGGTKKITYKKG